MWFFPQYYEKNRAFYFNFHRVQEVAKQTSIENRAKIEELEETNKELSNKLAGLESKLSNMSDYETTKKDLSILRSLEFGDENLEQRPLEVMILERSKALQVNKLQFFSKENIEFRFSPPNFFFKKRMVQKLNIYTLNR